MKTAAQPIKKPAPVYCISSFTAPLVAVGVGCLAIRLAPVGDSGWGMVAWVFAFCLVAASAVAGVLLAIIGNVLHERCGVLRWTVLLLNAILLFYLFMIFL
jgi:hypothetical protein